MEAAARAEVTVSEHRRRRGCSVQQRTRHACPTRAFFSTSTASFDNLLRAQRKTRKVHTTAVSRSLHRASAMQSINTRRVKGPRPPAERQKPWAEAYRFCAGMTATCKESIVAAWRLWRRGRKGYRPLSALQTGRIPQPSQPWAGKRRRGHLEFAVCWREPTAQSGPALRTFVADFLRKCAGPFLP